VGITYENQRVVFDQIARKYREYIALYRMLNNDSVEGLTPFDIFYWRMVYYSKYQERRNYGSAGY
jgi:hypothetical protein